MRGRQQHQELSPTLYEQCMASLTYTAEFYMSKGYEMGPTVYHPNLLIIIIIGKYIML